MALIRMTLLGSYIEYLVHGWWNGLGRIRGCGLNRGGAPQGSEV